MYSGRFKHFELKALPKGQHCDGKGLYLEKTSSDQGKWVYRFTLNRKQHRMGLGRYPDVLLQEARNTADKARALVRAGVNPILQRQAKQRAAVINSHLFRDVAEQKFEVEKQNLKGDGRSGRWFSPLKHHVLPTLGHVPIVEIDQLLIRDTLAPIWQTKCDTALKALNRTRMVFRHAAAMGLPVDLNAVELARELLGDQNHKVRHVEAMPWQQVPLFYQSLSYDDRVQLALKLTILTGVRPRVARECHLDHIDGDVWTVPGDGMKGRKNRTPDFRIPLTAEALKVIEAAKTFERDGFIFASQRGRNVITDAGVSKYVREVRELPYKVHGFRSSLRTWADAETDAPYEIKEMLLAHKERNRTARAYIRTDYLDERRALLERWTEVCLLQK